MDKVVKIRTLLPTFVVPPKSLLSLMKLCVFAYSHFEVSAYIITQFKNPIITIADLQFA